MSKCDLCWAEFDNDEELAKHEEMEEAVDWPIGGLTPVSAEGHREATAVSDEAEHAVWQWSPHQFVSDGSYLCLLCGARPNRAIHDRKWAFSGGRGFIANVPHGPDGSGGADDHDG